MTIHYFGTNLNDCGHYFWTLDNDRLIKKGLSFPAAEPIPLPRHREWPFDPQNYPRRGSVSKKGDVRYYREKGYTIVAIDGSCRDLRSGTRTVFFTLEEITFSDFVAKLLETPISKSIIEKMPFQIEWGLPEQ